MRLPILTSLATCLLLAVGCSDIPSPPESTADTTADMVATIEGDASPEVRYSSQYLRLWEVRREANKALIVEQALADGSSHPGMYQFKAYADTRAKMDPRFRAELANQRERIHRSWEMSDFDPTRSAYSHRDEDRSNEYLKTLLNRYNLDYVALRRMGKSTPDEFLSPVVQEDQEAAASRADFAASTSSEKFHVETESSDPRPTYDPNSGFRDPFDLSTREVGGAIDPLYPGAAAAPDSPVERTSADGPVEVADPLAGAAAVSGWVTIPVQAADGTSGTMKMDVTTPTEFQGSTTVPSEFRGDTVPSEFLDDDDAGR